MTVDAVQSEAASQHYVDTLTQNIDLSISSLSTLTLSGLSSKIDTVVSAVTGNLAAFNATGNVYDSLLPVSSMLVLDNLGQIAQMTYLPTIHLKNKTPGLILYAHEIWVETNEFGEDYLVVGSKARIDPAPLSGAFTGAMLGSGLLLTINKQWGIVFHAPLSIHKFGIISGLFHYGGNIIHTFATASLSSVVSWPLGITGGLWTQLWGLAYGELRGAPRSAYVALFIGIVLYLCGAYVIAF